MVDTGSNANLGHSLLELEHEIAFVTLLGESLQATAKKLELLISTDNTHCTLTVVIKWDVYQQLIAGEWMGLLSSARSGASAIGFGEDQPIELRIQLRSSLEKVILRKGAEIEQVLEALLEDSEESRILLQSESWLVFEVKQQLIVPDELAGGTLKKGYRTLWAESAVSTVATVAVRDTLNEVVEAYITRMELPFEWVDESILRLNFTGEQGEWIVLIRTDEEKRLCIVYSIYPELVPAEHRAGMANFLFEENYDLSVGNFEMDAADGELRYRTSIDVENDRLSMELLNQLFTTNVVIMDHYLDAIGDILQQGINE